MIATVVLLCGVVSPRVVYSTPISSPPITFEEQFILAQWLHADLTLDAIVTGVFEEAPRNLIGEVTSIVYEGQYSIVTDSLGNVTASGSGSVNGLFMGAMLELALTEVTQSPTIKLESVGSWQKTANRDGTPVCGQTASKDEKDKARKFKDDGEVEIDDKKAKVTLGITYEAGDTKRKTVGPDDFEYKKSGDTTTLEGSTTVIDKEEAEDCGQSSVTVKIVFNDKTKDNRSQIVSKATWGTWTLTNFCKKTSATPDSLSSTEIVGTTTCIFETSVSPVPEPTTLALMALGLAGLGFSKKKRAA